MYATTWDAEPHGVPRTPPPPPRTTSATPCGQEMGVNNIRWVHPTELPPHIHEDAEQAIVVPAGPISFTIDGEALRWRGDVAVVPRGAVHSGHSIEGEAVFVEAFAPLRAEHLVGFLGDTSIPTQEDRDGPPADHHRVHVETAHYGSNNSIIVGDDGVIP